MSEHDAAFEKALAETRSEYREALDRLRDDDQTAESDAGRSPILRVCFNWTAPAIWPHAVPDITRFQTTDDPAGVNCPSCQWALGSQKHEPPTSVLPPEGSAR